MLKKRTLSEQAYDELVGKIISREYPAGTTLQEEKLAMEFGISRTPVREALKHLAAEGVIEQLPRKGFRVALPDDDALRELFECRCDLEELALRKALSAIPSDKVEALTPETAGELRASIPAGSKSPLLCCLAGLLDASKDKAHRQLLLSDYEIAADKDLGTSKTLSKMGPMLGLMGTLIPMGPALVGLSTGDIGSMAYNMQVAFATTVVGLFSAAIGFITQQVKQRWYTRDLNRLEFVSEVLDGCAGFAREKSVKAGEEVR